MTVYEDLRAVAARFMAEESQSTCAFCGKGHLVLIDERPDPNFGMLGMMDQTLKCDSPDCGKITVL